MKTGLLILLGGLLFGWGLAVCGLSRQETVLSFLELRDLGLALTMMSAYVVTVPVFLLLPRLRRAPLLGGADEPFQRFPMKVSRDNLVGAVIFGTGWGLSGLCPGSAVASLGLLNTPVLYGLAGMVVGAYLQGLYASRGDKLERTLQES